MDSTNPVTSDTTLTTTMSSSEQGAAPPQQNGLAATTEPGDMAAMLQKLNEQQSLISKLSEEIKAKDSDIQKFSQRTRDEMKKTYETMIKTWLDSLETSNEEARNEFKQGVERLADRADNNGIWEICLAASDRHKKDSANAAKKEEEYQQLKTRYDELKQKADGGMFIEESSRVGSKRHAVGQPDTTHNTNRDIWEEFSGFMNGNYNHSTFQAPGVLQR